MLLPLGAGLAFKARYEKAAARVKPVLDRVSSLSLVLLVLLISVANIRNVLDVFAHAASWPGSSLLYSASALGGSWGDRKSRRDGYWH